MMRSSRRQQQQRATRLIPTTSSSLLLLGLLTMLPLTQAWTFTTTTTTRTATMTSSRAAAAVLVTTNAASTRSSTALFAGKSSSSSSSSPPTTWEEQGAAGFIPPPLAVTQLIGRVGPGGFGGAGPPLQFQEVLEAIEACYEYTPKTFINGDVTNEAGTNAGSCKLLSLGILHGLPTPTLLALFGEHYRSVIQTPKGSDHGNIRNLLSKGWGAVSFPDGIGLVLKKKK